MNSKGRSDKSKRIYGLEECRLEKCHFGAMSSEEILQMSVLSVTNSQTFDQLGAPAIDGLYDRRLGTIENGINCQTCGQNFMQCVGHMGHIELPCPVYNPLHFKELQRLLQCICRKCFRLNIATEKTDLFLIRTKLILAADLQRLNDLNHNSLLQFDDKESLKRFLAKTKKEVSDLKPIGTMTKTIVDLKAETLKDFYDSTFRKVTKSCCHCQCPTLVYKSERMLQISAHVRKGVKIVTGSDSLTSMNDPMNPSTAYEVVKSAWSWNHEVLDVVYGSRFTLDKPSPEIFFIHNIAVFPSKYRPFTVMNQKKGEHLQTTTYGQILRARRTMLVFVKMLAVEDEDVEKSSVLLEDEKKTLSLCKGKTLDDKFESAWLELQRTVNNLMDSQRAPTYERVKGVKQMIEKKEGVFRNNMMGKRVNFGARSVITPDPMLSTNEVGVPFELAIKLSFPEPVTRLNMQKVKRFIRNGPTVYPGANFIVEPNGSMIMLSKDAAVRDKLVHKLMNSKAKHQAPHVLYRHVLDGDVVMLNRQPTLHKPSIQAHIVRVLRYEKTIRLHYSACKAYNADFDGDEVNMHFPQSLNARSEGYHLMNSANFYLTPKDGSPLGGLIQDHIVGAVHLTMRGTFFTKEQYQNLIMFALPFYTGTITYLRPAILKPRVLWSGKQVFSTILQLCLPQGEALPNYLGKSKVDKKLWSEQAKLDPFYESSGMDDSVLRISEGELLQGVIDKTSIGSADLSFTHCIYELYGPLTCSRFLSACSKLMTNYLQHMRGFTLGVKDVLCTGDAEKVRRKKNKASLKLGAVATAEALLGEMGKSVDVRTLQSELESIHRKRDMFKLTFWEKLMTGKVGTLNSELTKACIPYGLKARFPENNLLMMIESGAKGSAINMAQIAAQNGQIELEGRRIPMQLSGKHLPCFKPYDLNPEAGGFAYNRFLTGLRPSQYVYHCMAGRDGLVDTAVKTSSSGYLQRCLIKLLEGVKVHYDNTVRDCDSSLVQFLFGEDGLDPIKSSYLKSEKTMKTLIDNRKVYDERVNACRTCVDTAQAKSYVKDLELHKLSAQSNELVDAEGKIYPPCKIPSKVPVIAHLSPALFFGSVSEKFAALRENSVPKGGGEGSTTYNKCSRLLNYKFMHSLMEPGEGIGLITGQSIGEPSTQMTLNTFHFAGRGDVNVTLGIPRLRELLQTASRNIKTPTMTVPLLNTAHAAREAERLSKDFRKIYLEDVLVSVDLESSYSTDLKRQYKAKFNFVSKKYLKNLTFIKPRHILKFMEHVFLAFLGRKYDKCIKLGSAGEPSCQNADEALDEDGNVMSGHRTRRRNLSDGESDVEDNPEVGGTATEKSLSKLDDERDYDDVKDAEDELAETDNELDEDAGNETGDEHKNEKGENPDGEHPSSVPVVHSVSQESHDERVATFLKDTPDFIIGYDFDTIKESHCTVTYQFYAVESPLDFGVFIRDEAAKAVLCSKAKGVSRAVVSEGKFVTEGVNIEHISQFSKVFDLSELYTNSIHHLLNHFGIEAAYVGIMKELGAVFGSYGIAVDRRHLSLVADYMTQSGTIKAFDRKQIASNPSHIQRASFESAFSFLKHASVSGFPDDLLSPSSCISVGKVCSIGTGAFDLLAKRTKKTSGKRTVFD